MKKLSVLITVALASFVFSTGAFAQTNSTYYNSKVCYSLKSQLSDQYSKLSILNSQINHYTKIMNYLMYYLKNVKLTPEQYTKIKSQYYVYSQYRYKLIVQRNQVYSTIRAIKYKMSYYKCY